MKKTTITPYWITAVAALVLYFSISVFEILSGPHPPAESRPVAMAFAIACALWAVQFLLIAIRTKVTLIILLVWMTMQFLGGLSTIAMRSLFKNPPSNPMLGLIFTALIIGSVALHLKATRHEQA